MTRFVWRDKQGEDDNEERKGNGKLRIDDEEREYNHRRNCFHGISPGEDIFNLILYHEYDPDSVISSAGMLKQGPYRAENRRKLRVIRFRLNPGFPVSERGAKEGLRPANSGCTRRSMKKAEALFGDSSAIFEYDIDEFVAMSTECLMKRLMINQYRLIDQAVPTKI